MQYPTWNSLSGYNRYGMERLLPSADLATEIEIIAALQRIERNFDALAAIVADIAVKLETSPVVPPATAANTPVA